MFNKLCRVGNSVELRYTPSGATVMNLSLAYQYGKKGDDGKRPTQWIDASMWGKQAEALQPYINKGDQVSVSLDDLHIETYESKNGQGHKLVGRVVGFDFVSNPKQGSTNNQENKPAASQSGSGFYDDDPDPHIPF